MPRAIFPRDTAQGFSFCARRGEWESVKGSHEDKEKAAAIQLFSTAPAICEPEIIKL